MAPVETAAENAFDDEVVGGAGCAHSDAKIDLPCGRDVEVGNGEELMLLILER
jgi:hypothetical protein